MEFHQFANTAVKFLSYQELIMDELVEAAEELRDRIQPFLRESIRKENVSSGIGFAVRFSDKCYGPRPVWLKMRYGARIENGRKTSSTEEFNFRTKFRMDVRRFDVFSYDVKHELLSFEDEAMKIRKAVSDASTLYFTYKKYLPPDYLSIPSDDRKVGAE